MKLFHITLAGAFAALTLTGCLDDTGKEETGFETGDTTECSSVETLIQEIYADCDSSNWTYRAITDGWTSDGTVNIDQTGIDPQYAWSEEHDLPSVDYGTDDGCWDKIERVLPMVTDWQQQEANTNTLFECSSERKSTLTWMIRVYDTDGVMSDCAVWGEDTGFYAEYDCLDWN